MIEHAKGIRMKHLNIAMILAVLSFTCVGVHGQGVALAAEQTPAGGVTVYPDGRPSATLRMEAKDQGVVLKHGDGPGQCDNLGAREALIFEEKGVYHLFYDGAGPKGWLACLATSKDLKTWEKKGPILDFGKPGESDSAAACSPWVYFDGKEWHMFYLGTPNTSGAPDLIPAFPYLTLKARSQALSGPWIKQPEVVPFCCQPKTYYDVTASPGHIVQHDGGYLMFFSAAGNDQRGTHRTISIARTKDLNGPWAIDPQPIVPPAEQIENSSLYFEPSNKTWFLFTNHIGLDVDGGEEYTDAVWVYWSKDLNRWDAKNKAVVLDGKNCTWSKKCLGMPSVIVVGKRLAIFYDAPGGFPASQEGNGMKRDIGLAWLELPLSPPKQYAADVASLRCEYLESPLGIDVVKPRLSWVIEERNQKPEARDLKQTAYQVLVASSPELLAKDKGDLWDSGKVESDQSIQVEYAGKPMASRMRCFWKVRAWTRSSVGKPAPGTDEPTAWSQLAFWEMGLLTPAEWSAKWIETVSGPVEAPAAVPASLSILKAVYKAEGAEKNVTSIVAGMVTNHTLNMNVNNAMLGGDPAVGKVKQLVVEYELGGKRLAQTVNEDDTLSIPEDQRSSASRLSYLRKTFNVGKAIAKARLYATALGLYEIHINGQRVGDHVFAPEWTEYRKRVRYQVYDVTSMVKKGDNALGALLGHGWYSGHVAWDYQVYGKIPALCVQLELTYRDGTVERIASDATWKCHGSPVVASDLLMGENYDARLEVPGWDAPGMDDRTWVAAKVRDDERRLLNGQVMEPSRKICELPATKIAEPKPGCWVFDMGQNMVGYVRLKVKAATGTKVVLRFAEMLNPDGTIYTANLRSAKVTDTYTCKGGGVETWQPLFTFHGFRHVEVTGLEATPAMDLVTGIVIASDTPRAGEFACSDARVNQLYANIVWGQRGNYLSVPMDCPQRDERLGWTGDAQVFVKTAAMNNNIAAFFTKWLVDVDDVQYANGAFTDFVPMGGGAGAPAWADAGVICPWTIYLAYGDKRVLEQHLPAMTAWIERCRDQSTNLIRDKDRGSDFGDWLSIGADTPKEVIGTAYFAYSTRIVAKAYAVLGRNDEAARYEQLFQDIKAAFNKEYVAPDGRIRGNTQCCYAMALKFDLLSEGMKAKAAQYLEDDIKAKGWHLSTGFVGVSYLLPVLTEAGKIETAYRLLLQDTFPSWLFSVKHGATTIWERWDGWTPEKGFQDPGMNSFNHYSLGSCGEWLFNSLAGIAFDPDAPGYRHIICKPHPGAGITWVKASYNSIQGMIVSGWKTDAGAFIWDLTIPPNTTATVYVPAKDAAGVTESNKQAAKADGVKFLRMENNAAVYAVGSGTYRFQSTLTETIK